MLLIIFITAGSIFLLLSLGMFLLQDYKIKKGTIVVDPSYSGAEHVSITIAAIIRYLLKRSVHVRKFLIQYVLHMMVRCMYYFDLWTRKMYEVSRNWFVKNAVKNKGTVPHFWEHLKTYKQEMDKEKEREGDIK